MQSSNVALAFKPLREMFVFSGRSRRSEVIAFLVLSIFANLGSLVGPNNAVVSAIHAAWSFLWGFPWIALLVRRLHDQGRSARWAFAIGAVFAGLLISAPLLPQSADSNYHVTLLLWTFHPVGPLAIVHAVVGAIVVFVLLYLYLAPEELGTNRYGADPRLDPDDAIAISE